MFLNDDLKKKYNGYIWGGGQREAGSSLILMTEIPVLQFEE